MPAIQIERSATDPHQSDNGIRADTSSRGVDLAGARITATYTDGTTEVLIWQAYDPWTFGGAAGTDITMDFGFALHELEVTKRLASLEFDLQPASSVWDTTLAMDSDPAGGSTPSSNNGFPFEVGPDFTGLGGTITASYSGIVNLTGSAAVGDLFTTMTVDFTGLAGGGLLGALDWNSDIDTMAFAGDLVAAGPNHTGGPGGDAITGTGNDDTLRGMGGDDTLDGEGGNDLLNGGNDEDDLEGGSGTDRLYGNGGNDTLDGESGADSLYGGTGDDEARGGSGIDEILGQGGADAIWGEAGNDVLRGGSGNDLIYGGNNNDQLFGNGNNDTLDGGSGNDTLQGAAGADELIGGAGADWLTGGVGGDKLDGGTGNDTMNGGTDNVRDTFVFGTGYDQDRINGFDQAGNDRIELDAALWAGTLTAQAVVDTYGSLNAAENILTLDFGGGDILEIQNAAGINAATLGADILIV